MALLKPNQVVFYHPCDNLTEFTKGLGWTAHGGGTFTSAAIFGSGLIPFNGQDYGISYPSGDYASPGGATSLTVAFWTTQGMANEEYVFGWSDAGYGRPINGVDLTVALSLGRTYITPFTNGSNGSAYWTINDLLVGSGLCVVRLEYGASSVSGFYSFNGAAWASLGAISLSSPTATGSDVFVGSQGTYSQGYPVDEVVLWKDVPVFSTQELSNLYHLGLSFGKTMDQYSTVFNNTPSGMVRLSVTGSACSSGTSPLALLGHDVSCEYQDLFLQAPQGYYACLPLYLHNQTVAGDIPLYLHNQQAMGNLDLYLYGVLGANRPMFLRTYDSVVSGTIDLSLYGSSGNTVQVQTGTADLFLANDSSPASTGITRPLFLKAAIGGTPGSLTARPLFLKGGGVAQAIANLYVAGPVPVISKIGCFIRGDGDEALSGGYTPVSDSRVMFLRVRNGAIVQLAMSITGFAWPSGTCDLNINGILGTSSGLFPTSLAGYNRAEESLNLTICGVLGTASGAAPLFLEVTSTGVAGGTMAAYCHGF